MSALGKGPLERDFSPAGMDRRDRSGHLYIVHVTEKWEIVFCFSKQDTVNLLCVTLMKTPSFICMFSDRVKHLD